MSQEHYRIAALKDYVKFTERYLLRRPVLVKLQAQV